MYTIAANVILVKRMMRVKKKVMEEILIYNRNH